MERFVKKAITIIAALSLVLVLYPATPVLAEELEEEAIEEVVEELVEESEEAEESEEIVEAVEEEVEAVEEVAEEEATEETEETEEEEEAETECVNMLSATVGSSFSGSTVYAGVTLSGKSNVTKITGSVSVQDATTGRMLGTWSINKAGNFYSASRGFSGAVKGHTYRVATTFRMTNTSGYTETLTVSNTRTY